MSENYFNREIVELVKKLRHQQHNAPSIGGETRSIYRSRPQPEKKQASGRARAVALLNASLTSGFGPSSPSRGSFHLNIFLWESRWHPSFPIWSNKWKLKWIPDEKKTVFSDLFRQICFQSILLLSATSVLLLKRWKWFNSDAEKTLPLWFDQF